METKDLTMDPEILRAALVGYQNRLDEVERRIVEVKGMLKDVGESTGDTPPSLGQLLNIPEYDDAPHPIEKSVRYRASKTKPKRQISPAGREAIAAATKKRWKAWRKAQKTKAA